MRHFKFIPILIVFSLGFAHAQNSTEEAATSSNAAAGFWSQHFRVVELEQAARFDYMDTSSHELLNRDLQYRIRGVGQVNLTGSGSTYVQFRAESGPEFDTSWNNTGLGSNSGAADFFVKSLFIGQRIGSHLELQAGGIEFERGAGSEHTYASEDGYMTGYRAAITGIPRQYGIDKFITTVGYVGDFEHPNVFPRLQDDMNRVNYVQVLAQRKFGEKAEGSAELDSIRGIWYTREALRWRRPFGSLLDEVLVEAITRTSNGPTAGGSVTLSRALDHEGRFHGMAIYSQLPASLFEKNDEPIFFPQEEIDRGKRISLGADYDVTHHFFVGVFAGRLLDNTSAKRYIAQVAVGYDYTDLVNRLFRPGSN